MKIDVISFTRAGARLSVQLKKAMEGHGAEQEDCLELFTKYSGTADTEENISCPAEKLQEWAGERFTAGKGILFIGACGIAVRSIAPFIRSKASDPAVLVMDEKGEYVIPILSGHLGQANRIAKKIAALTGARAVLTTATDVNDLFAADVFAGQNGLHISDMKKVKEISAALLEGERVTLYYDRTALDVEGVVPRLLTVHPLPDDVSCIPMSSAAQKVLAEEASLPAHLVYITSRRRTDAALCLIPRQLYLGVGCRKGKSAEELRRFVDSLLLEHDLDRAALAGVYSIDLKKEEEGICELAQGLGLPFLTFSPEELQEAEGEFHGSEFVKARTGVDNVCERAVIAAGADKILVPKTGRDGMTLSIGIRKGKICFE